MYAIEMIAGAPFAELLFSASRSLPVAQAPQRTSNDGVDYDNARCEMATVIQPLFSLARLRSAARVSLSCSSASSLAAIRALSKDL